MRDYEFYYTQDGSVGLYSYADDDVFHSKYGAITEAWQKFVISSGIDKLLNTKPNIKVLDICYGIGYNTKALMSYVIFSDEEKLKLKNKNFLILKTKNLLKNFGKNLKEDINIETIDNYNIRYGIAKLLLSIEPIEDETLSKISIDCLDIDKNLIKISPLLKTMSTPQEIITKIIPKSFSCFETYWKLIKLISKIYYRLSRGNSKKIIEKLNLKYSNDYDEPDKSYSIHKFVNLILADRLLDQYNDEYYTESLIKFIKKKENRRYIDKHIAKYLNLKYKTRYNFISRINLLTNLHNIYYDYLSKRYKNARYDQVEKLFDLKFYAEDARKSILKLDGQYDLIFLDAFTYTKAPELWSSEFMAELYNRLSSRGYLLTYSNSALVRNTLLENNFYIGKIVDNKTGSSIGTIAAKDKSLIKNLLSNYELGLCGTKAGIPYHDYGLSSPRDVILKRRENDFKNSDLLTSSQYMKRRLHKPEESEDEQ